MDLATVDTTEVPGAAIGDIVTIYGKDDSDSIEVSDVAREINTVTSDLLCALGRRVRRFYLAYRSPLCELTVLLPRHTFPANVDSLSNHWCYNCRSTHQTYKFLRAARRNLTRSYRSILRSGTLGNPV